MIGGITLYRTYALYEEKREFNVIRGKVPEFAVSGNDVSLAVIVNGKRQSTFPGKYEGYTIDKVECTKNAIGTWDSNTWSINVTNLEENNTICTVSFKRYAEEILNGADPKLGENLIPVKIADDGTVTKADTMQEWYNYSNKEWANAVILLDKTITYNNNDVIPESNIESYFVWIPKYSYQLWDLGEYIGSSAIDESKVHPIPIKFGLGNTSDSVEGECTTPMNEDKTQGLSGESGNCVVGDYMTHPAFISMNTNGLWVGKFTTGYKGATTTSEAQVNNDEPEKVQIKPNVYSWRSIQAANAHLNSYNYKRDLDSHMMKNTEWGAVAYLQHSAYGSATSVRINNNDAYITGYAAINETIGYNGHNDYESTSIGVDGTKTVNYKNPISQVASTTGNYTGIYDMYSKTKTHVMGMTLDGVYGMPVGTDICGFNGWSGNGKTEYTSGINYPNTQYYDSYNFSGGMDNYKRRILGDATGELGPFYNAKSSWNGMAYLVAGGEPFVVRFGFSFGGGGSYSGGANNNFGYRIVLAP